MPRPKRSPHNLTMFSLRLKKPPLNRRARRVTGRAAPVLALRPVDAARVAGRVTAAEARRIVDAVKARRVVEKERGHQIADAVKSHRIADVAKARRPLLGEDAARTLLQANGMPCAPFSTG